MNEPLFTADWQGVAKFVLVYGGVLTAGILSVRKWINTPMKEKYDALQEHIDELQKDATKEHLEIYKEIDRRIGLEPGTSVKTMADGIGSRIQATEIELGRLEVTVERFDTTSRSQHEAVMRAMLDVTKQIAGLNATVGLLIERRMERLDRIADHLGGS